MINTGLPAPALSRKFVSISAKLLTRMPPFQGKRTKASTDDREQPNVIEIKLDRLIDEMRFLRSQMIALHTRLEAYRKPSEPSEQQPESKSRPWFVAAASATA